MVLLVNFWRWRRTVYFVGAVFVVVLLATTGTAFAQTALTLLGTSTPATVDAGDPTPVVLGVKIFSDVPDRFSVAVFTKRLQTPESTWSACGSSAGKVIGQPGAGNRDRFGKTIGSVLVSGRRSPQTRPSPADTMRPTVTIRMTTSAFAVQKDVSTLTRSGERWRVRYGHASQRRGRCTSGRRAATGSTCCSLPPTSATSGSATWISGANVSLTSSGATVTWNTSVPSDSQVEYGPTTSYGNTTALAAARVTSHAITMSNLVPGTAYHFRVHSSDSDGVPAVGLDHAFALAAPVSVSASPANVILVSAKTQQFTAIVSNTSNTACHLVGKRGNNQCIGFVHCSHG